MYIFYFIEANLFCSFILLLILANEIFIGARQEQQVIFCNTLVWHILFFLADCVWILVDGSVLPKTHLILGIINFVKIILVQFCFFFWFVYVEFTLKKPAVTTYKGRFRVALPMLEVTFIFFIMFLLGNGYSIGANDTTYHSALYYSTLIVPSLYVSYATIQCVKAAFQKDNYSDRFNLIALTLYPIVIGGFGILQIFFQRIPFFCFGACIVAVCVYILSLNSRVSTDPLTKLNNRSQLLRFVHQWEHGQHFSEDTLYILIIDADRFKSINDTYGHMEGDHALILISQALQKVCGSYTKNRCFLARYGGDEFIIITCADSENELREMSASIRTSLSELCVQSHIPYLLEVSIGWAPYLRNDTFPSSILRADKAMYLDKQRRKQDKRRAAG